ncbi:YueI family protein [Peribacillus sp. B-H-3]|uniref:YueI family protein n=1 Tax=Peribacillus sp. B-H-3 TaxID=3400420 RepID=UPI003B028F4C
MSRLNVDEILHQGIHGKKEIKPDEKKKFLGTFRERVIVVLTQAQVRETKLYEEVAGFMNEHKDAKLLLNGKVDVSHLNKYITLASRYHIPYKIVINKEGETNLGLVLAKEYAIDKEDIYLTKKKVQKPARTKVKWYFKLYRFLIRKQKKRKAP